MIALERNKDFGYQKVEDKDDSIVTPSVDFYKYLNADSPIVRITVNHLEAFLGEYKKMTQKQ